MHWLFPETLKCIWKYFLTDNYCKKIVRISSKKRKSLNRLWCSHVHVSHLSYQVRTLRTSRRTDCHDSTITFQQTMYAGDKNPIWHTNIWVYYHRYDTTTGTFTADKAGLYHFEVHLLFDEEKWGDVYIRKNDTNQCVQWGQGGSNADGVEIHIACTAILELEVLEKFKLHIIEHKSNLKTA